MLQFDVLPLSQRIPSQSVLRNQENFSESLNATYSSVHTFYPAAGYTSICSCIVLDCLFPVDFNRNAVPTPTCVSDRGFQRHDSH